MFSAGGFAFLIFPFIACLIGGVFLGWVQWLVLRVHVQSASYSLLLISGVAWLLGPVLIWMSFILASLVNTSIGRSWARFQIFLMVSVLLSLSGMIGSFLKGRVLVKLLKRKDVLTHHEN